MCQTTPSFLSTTILRHTQPPLRRPTLLNTLISSFETIVSEMKKCELCKVPARIFCESDQASLCWDCDAKVHGANFLVERHTRTLLCHACQSPTPWKASGAALGNTVSLCERCAGGTTEQGQESQGGNDDDIDTDIDTDDEDDYDESEDEVAADEEDGDNQVVPWSSEPPPPAPSSSSSEESVSRCNNVDEVSTTLKRRRQEDNDFQVCIQLLF